MTDEEERAEMLAIEAQLEAIHGRLMARALTFNGHESDPERARQSAASYLAEICAGFGGDTLSAVLQVFGNSLGSILEDHYCCLPHAVAEVGQVAKVAIDRMQVGLEAHGHPEADESHTKH